MIERVTSSRNSGLPAARSRIFQTTSGGSGLSRATLRMNASDSSGSRDPSSTVVKLVASAHVGANSGRAVSKAIRLSL